MAETSLRKLAITITLVIATTLVNNPTSPAAAAANVVKTKVFLSPEIVSEPGLVSEKNFYGIDFPAGHIAIKSFNAELVDGRGEPVSLHETYLHHWVLQRYHARKNSTGAGDNGVRPAGYTLIRNGGICDNTLKYYYGVGAETRRTPNDVPDPYGIEVGNPATIPAGYEEGWMLNVHAIDTRGAVDKMGCSECRCDLYNVAKEALPPNYIGGLGCCSDEKRCTLKQGFHSEKRSIYLKYTIKYVDWDSTSMLPVTIYVFDVTDVWTKGDEFRGIKPTHNCGVEFDIKSCDVEVEKNGCIDTKSVSFSFPNGGDVIYGVGHQHAGATAAALYGEDGRTICLSNPIYGEGNEAGNEAGFIVEMSTCYPSPVGSVKISAGETLTLVSNYSSVENHTGVMTVFYLLLADSSEPKTLPILGTKITMVPKFVWPAILLGVVLVVVAIVASKAKSGNSEGYESMLRA